jgi:hypothetical protein
MPTPGRVLASDDAQQMVAEPAPESREGVMR